MRGDVAAALGDCLILPVLTVYLVEVIRLLAPAPPMEKILAFAPAGQAEMTVLALIVGAGIALVIAHHVLRIVVVILASHAFRR